MPEIKHKYKQGEVSSTGLVFVKELDKEDGRRKALVTCPDCKNEFKINIYKFNITKRCRSCHMKILRENRGLNGKLKGTAGEGLIDVVNDNQEVVDAMINKETEITFEKESNNKKIYIIIGTIIISAIICYLFC